MLIKGEDADNIILGDTFTKDGFDRRDGKKCTFDYMLANPPFGVEWKQQQRDIEKERDIARLQRPLRRRPAARSTTARCSSSSTCSRRCAPRRKAAAASPSSSTARRSSPATPAAARANIRRWIIENDWLEAIVALPDQLFYNTGISTYIWVLTNRKEQAAQGQGPAHRCAHASACR